MSSSSSSSIAASEARVLRERGNQLFQSGLPADAVVQYSQALALLIRGGPLELAAEIATVLSNRR